MPDLPLTPSDPARGDGHRSAFLTRRAALAAAGFGAAALILEPFGAGSASAATATKLPGELSRKANQRTATGAKLYDNIDVNIGGDRARIYLPQTVKKGASTAVGVVWFHHALGSSHAALDSVFKTSAELVVDNGAIAICMNAGGDQYTNAFAEACQVNAYEYLGSMFNVKTNLLRATSAGGALASYTYAKKLIPYITGLYTVNGVYDLEAMANRDPAKRAFVLSKFNNDENLMIARNPARLPASSWANSRVRVVVSDAAHPDPAVAQEANGLALLKLVTPVAKEATVRYHTLGHGNPSFVHKDMLATFGRWLGR